MRSLPEIPMFSGVPLRPFSTKPTRLLVPHRRHWYCVVLIMQVIFTSVKVCFCFYVSTGERFEVWALLPGTLAPAGYLSFVIFWAFGFVSCFCFLHHLLHHFIGSKSGHALISSQLINEKKIPKIICNKWLKIINLFSHNINSRTWMTNTRPS